MLKENSRSFVQGAPVSCDFLLPVKCFLILPSHVVQEFGDKNSTVDVTQYIWVGAVRYQVG